MAKASTGNCYCCGAEISKTAIKNHLLKVHNEPDGAQECCLLKIEGAHSKGYWLYIDVPINKTLASIDDFLRAIWLECCGHMSAFTDIADKTHEEIAFSRKLSSFAVGSKLLHEYDFGSTTETLITFVGIIKRKRQKEAVRLLARNVPPQFQCTACGKIAAHICTECIYESDNPFYCDECGENHEHDDMLLPVTNSPRMGVCGYDGESGVFIFNPAKISQNKGL